MSGGKKELFRKNKNKASVQALLENVDAKEASGGWVAVFRAVIRTPGSYRAGLRKARSRVWSKKKALEGRCLQS